MTVLVLVLTKDVVEGDGGVSVGEGIGIGCKKGDAGSRREEDFCEFEAELVYRSDVAG